jgi:kinesin family protein 5
MRQPALTQDSFESQLTAVKERLEAAKAGSTRGLSGSANAGASFAFGGGVGSRIAKPLRGGGGEGPTLPVIGNLQKQDGEGEANKTKRTSWFFNQR